MDWLFQTRTVSRDSVEALEERLLKIERSIYLLKIKVRELDVLVQASLRKSLQEA
jgi:hypothetical protein